MGGGFGHNSRFLNEFPQRKIDFESLNNKFKLLGWAGGQRHLGSRREDAAAFGAVLVRTTGRRKDGASRRPSPSDRGSNGGRKPVGGRVVCGLLPPPPPSLWSLQTQKRLLVGLGTRQFGLFVSLTMQVIAISHITCVLRSRVPSEGSPALILLKNPSS